MVKSGSSRASTRSLGRVDGPVRMPVSTASSSAGLSAAAPGQHLAHLGRPGRAAPRPPARRACATSRAWRRARLLPAVHGSPDHDLLHRGPQPGGVQLRHVGLDLFLVAGRHGGLALVVHVEHQLGGLRLGVAEELLQHVGDVGHQVDRVVPDDRLPRDVGGDVLGRRPGPPDGGCGQRHGHASMVTSSRRGPHDRLGSAFHDRQSRPRRA